MDFGLYVITSSVPELGRDHIDVATAAIAGGASAIQLRIKRRSMGEALKIARDIHKMTQAAGIPLIINDHVGVAMASRAEGLHVGPDDLSVTAAIRMLGRGKIVGKSAAKLDEVRKAELEGAVYIGAGPVFNTATKPDKPPVGPGRISKIKALAGIPVIAIGGINAGNLDQCITAGADGVAVVSAVAMAEDMVAATRELRRALDLARRRPPARSGSRAAAGGSR